MPSTMSCSSSPWCHAPAATSIGSSRCSSAATVLYSAERIKSWHGRLGSAAVHVTVSSHTLPLDSSVERARWTRRRVGSGMDVG